MQMKAARRRKIRINLSVHIIAFLLLNRISQVPIVICCYDLPKTRGVLHVLQEAQLGWDSVRSAARPCLCEARNRSFIFIKYWCRWFLLVLFTRNNIMFSFFVRANVLKMRKHYEFRDRERVLRWYKYQV